MKLVQYTDRKYDSNLSFLFRLCKGNNLSFNGEHKATLECQSKSDFGILAIWEL